MNVAFDRTPVSESILIDCLRQFPARSVLCTSLGRGQVAAAAASQRQEAEVVCHFLDSYRSQKAEQSIGSASSRIRCVCTADFPDRTFDLAAIPCTARGDGELTRELLQSAFQRLEIGGHLAASTDNPRDQWLGDQFKRFFRNLHRVESKHGVVYWGVKAEALRKSKDYSCQFAFRDGARLVHVFSRPGVFSHRRLDLGARALIETMEIQPQYRILDIGCGAGVVSLAAGLRDSTTSITAIDSNPRALECTQRGAELNGLTTIATALTANADCDSPGSYDLAVANPPYYSHFRIGEIFLRGAERALRPNGELLLVTKNPDAYLKLIEAGFYDAQAVEVRKYAVIRAKRK